MINIIEAPNPVLNNGHANLFLAGGITNCPDWQTTAIDFFKSNFNGDLNIYNPRRKDFPIHDKDAAPQQIAWEYNKLKLSDYIIFWFAKGSINPIVLYELGMWGNSRKNKTIFIGCDKEYERTSDVIYQTKLARPEITIHTNFIDLLNNTKDEIITKI